MVYWKQVWFTKNSEKEKIAKNPGLLQVWSEMLNWGFREAGKKKEGKNSGGKDIIEEFK